MVNVTHDRHHRRTADFFAFEVHGQGQAVFQVTFLDLLDLVAHVFGNDGRGVLIQHLVDSHHVAVLEHVLDDLGRLHRHLLGQFGHGDGFTDYHFSHYGSCRLLEAVLITFFLRLELAGTTTTTRQGVLVFTARSATALAGATSALAAALVFIGPGLATLLFFLLRGSGRCRGCLDTGLLRFGGRRRHSRFGCYASGRRSRGCHGSGLARGRRFGCHAGRFRSLPGLFFL